MPPILLVMLGGAVGAGGRYALGLSTMRLWGIAYPYGTLSANLLGGLLMGVLAGVLARVGEGGETLRLLLGVGVLGGFTTFSAFSLEVHNMLVRGDAGTAIGYAALSLAGSVAALFAGVMIVRVVA